MDANWGYSMSNPMPLNGERVFLQFFVTIQNCLYQLFFQDQHCRTEEFKAWQMDWCIKMIQMGYDSATLGPKLADTVPPKMANKDEHIYIIMMRKYIKMMDNHEVFWTTVDSWWALPDISSSVSAQHPPYSALSGPKIVFSSAGVSRG